ncbi:hypothetical protein BB558_000782 [Smittium angustum]|uniref:Uncharacterized protein n=1 Tax=Smittium angustum TaxID=133377 RepID=A0A2U1JD89_SMIAN|nr:hypothetical protein BB558_000782 [Smittium angustum]
MELENKKMDLVNSTAEDGVNHNIYCLQEIHYKKEEKGIWKNMCKEPTIWTKYGAVLLNNKNLILKNANMILNGRIMMVNLENVGNLNVVESNHIDRYPPRENKSKWDEFSSNIQHLEPTETYRILRKN